MAKRTIPKGETPEFERSDVRDLEWVMAKTLLDANAHTVQAFEHHLLRTYREDATPDLESVQSNIRQAIDEHEKIIEDLETAERAVAEKLDESGTESSDK